MPPRHLVANFHGFVHLWCVTAITLHKAHRYSGLMNKQKDSACKPQQTDVPYAISQDARDRVFGSPAPRDRFRKHIVGAPGKKPEIRLSRSF